MSDARFSGALPKGDANGLGSIIPELINTPDRKHVIIGVIDNKQTIMDNDSGDVIPVVRLRRVEVVPKIDRELVEKILRRAVEARMGVDVLPLELEDEITALFADFDEAAE